MITLSNGHQFEYMAASGALAYFGRGWWWEKPLVWLGLLDPSLFTVVTKTLTYRPRRGNLRWYKPWSCVQPIRGGMVNAVGLTNPGYKWWCRERVDQLMRQACDTSKPAIPLVISLMSESGIKEVKVMARQLRRFPIRLRIVGVELNASCPNTQSAALADPALVVDQCHAVKDEYPGPLILKLSVMHDVGKIVPRIGGAVEALSINSVPWRLVYPNRKSPLHRHGGGGVSGQAAQPYTWQLVRRLADLTDIPVIGPSVWEFNDIARLRKLKAAAISFGSVFLRYPWRPTLFVRQDRPLAP